MPELIIYVDNQAVAIDVDSKSIVADLACEVEELGYSINVAHPEVRVNNTAVNMYEKVDTGLEYHFSKLS